MDLEIEDTNLITIWEVEQPDRKGVEPYGIHCIGPTNVALPEALLYHGLMVQDDGRHPFDILECKPEFIREVINTRHGISMGADYGAKVNDRLIDQERTRST